MSIGSFIAAPRPTGRRFRQALGSPVTIGQTSTEDQSLITFADDATYAAECLRCPDAPCTFFSQAEQEAELALDMTRDSRREVCAFDAISISADGAPVISEERCAGCGLCIERCPVGAIAWQSEGYAAVQSTDAVSEAAAEESAHLADRARGAAIRTPLELTDQEWPILRARFDEYIQALNGPNLRMLVRNLLRGLGARAHSGVRGDTSDRTEIIYESAGQIGLGEIEARVDLLEAVRRVMTAVAIAHSRRGVERERLEAVVFMLRLPNRRTDGYGLVRDLAQVLGLEIAVVPIAALHVGLLAAMPDVLDDIVAACRETHGDALLGDVARAVAEAAGVPVTATVGSRAFVPAK